MIAHKTVRVCVVEIGAHVARHVEDSVHEPLGCREYLAAEVRQGKTIVHLESSGLDLVLAHEAEALE